MTENEAINFFKDFIETLKINGEEQVLKNNYCKSANIAIKALEKQIPKKIIRRKAVDEDIESELRDFITRQGEICRCLVAYVVFI